MADIIRIENLKAEEIRQLLAEKGRELPEDQAAAARHSASQISQLKQAFDTLQSLRDLDEAA